ncbi:unnamed protein product [Paramecium primaurelia]|uniref:PHD-type domain-containing protein n=1 Tax=Paramecium primaurelia TaxID=5886 RepID=A0A8S1MJ92_PARPR|nr:unnamed protein product [Paramecium primaurelia]
MSQGMNNNSQIPFLGITQDLDLCQMFLSQQQNPLFQALLNSKIQQLYQAQLLQNLPQSLNLNNSSKDLFPIPNMLNVLPVNKPIELEQYFSNSTQFLQQANFLNPYHLQQRNFNQKQKNNVDNPITVDDDEPQQQQKKCHNPQCKNVGDKKIKSKKNDILFFCDKCSKLYNKGNYCDYCEQVYGSYDDEARWIQCDSCQKWNHIICEQKNRNQNIQIEIETNQYHCLTCSKNIKKPKIIKKVEEPPIIKQRPIIEQEDFRNREKNINFVATKDNKIQYTFRFNLMDDEIKQDLDQLRNSTKKKQKIQQSSPPKISQVIQTQQTTQPQQQQQIQQETQETSFNNRNLRRRINQKINYRDLIGEY